MSQATSTENIFRYVNMRSPKAFANSSEIKLEARGPFGKELVKLAGNENFRHRSQKWLQDHLQKSQSFLKENSCIEVLNLLKKSGQEKWKLLTLVEKVSGALSENS